MWCETEGGTMSDRKICPLMSDSRGSSSARGRTAPRLPRTLMGETLWYCEMIEGHPNETRGRS